MANAKIIGHGSYLPEKILTNAMLEKMVDTSDEWITSMTGIKSRHIAREDEYTSDIAMIAAKRALDSSGLEADEVELIIVASVTPDMMTPSVSCMVQSAIGASNAVAIDVNSACSGFIFALSTANAFIKSGAYQNALVIGADCLSKVTDYKDRSTCILFGDGAGAVLLQSTEDKTGIRKINLGSDGSRGMVLTLPVLKVPDEEREKRVSDRTMTIWMDGHEVYKFAVKILTDSTIKIMDDLGMGLGDIDVLIPHQANYRIVDSAIKRLKINRDRVFMNLENVGNISAACIPVALCEAMDSGFAKKGDRVVLVGFGGGLSWGSAVVEL